MSRFKEGDKVIPKLEIIKEFKEDDFRLRYPQVAFVKSMIKIIEEQKPFTIRYVSGKACEVYENIWTWHEDWLESYHELKVVEL